MPRFRLIWGIDVSEDLNPLRGEISPVGGNHAIRVTRAGQRTKQFGKVFVVLTAAWSVHGNGRLTIGSPRRLATAEVGQVAGYQGEGPRPDPRRVNCQVQGGHQRIGTAASVSRACHLMRIVISQSPELVAVRLGPTTLTTSELRLASRPVGPSAGASVMSAEFGLQELGGPNDAIRRRRGEATVRRHVGDRAGMPGLQ